MYLIGGAVGGIIGFAYHHLIGCNGACAISANPFISTIYGCVLGLLIAALFKKDKKKSANISIWDSETSDKTVDDVDDKL